MAVPALRRFSYAEYLARERETDIRHEFLDGHIVAMAGGTIRHSALKSNLLGAAYRALHGSPCRPYDSDLKVRVSATGLATYPDLTILCGPPKRDATDRHAATNPAAWFEVLSGGTEAWDRGDKFYHARHVESLLHYVLVSADMKRLEVFSRADDGTWTLRTYTEGQSFTLGGIGLSLDVDELYQDLPEEEPAEPEAP